MTLVKKKDRLKRKDLAVRITDWIGSTASIYIHTLFFIVIFILPILGISINTTLLFLTTAVSLEAIYLAILIQMTVNRNTQSLQEVEEDIDEIQADVDEIQKDVDEIQEDVDEIQEDVGEIEKDVDEIEKDVDELHAAESQEEKEERETRDTLDSIEKKLQGLIADIESLKKNNGK